MDHFGPIEELEVQKHNPSFPQLRVLCFNIDRERAWRSAIKRITRIGCDWHSNTKLLVSL